VKPLIVGESNPYGGDEYFALYPEPPGCAGDRLCRFVMGLRRATYMQTFERVNLVQGKWSAPRSRERAAEIIGKGIEGRLFNIHILLGRRVAQAFGFPDHWQPPRLRERGCVVFLMLPHPSGRNRAWHNPGMVEACREMLCGVLPRVPFGELENGEVSRAQV
jgi:hypothetical protein